MTPERWQRIKDVLDASLALQPEERKTYLSQACAGEPELLVEVESLIVSYELGPDFLDTPALASEAQTVLESLAGSGLGRKIGPYELVEEVGRGGMGTVYRAVRTGDFEQQVAIKLVKSGRDADFVVRRFRHERQIMAGLDHPNIARLLDGGSTEDGLPYFVLEFIAGRPIDEYCDEHRLTVRERLVLFRTVCAAVAYAHRKHVIHRDIKPGNILITSEGVPKLLDFGIAKILGAEPSTATRDRSVTLMRVMTPEYASPEQIRGEPVSSSTDIYSLGVLLYELLSGHRPYRFRSRAPHDVAQAICDAEPEKPSTAVLKTDSSNNIERLSGEATPASVGRARSSDPYRLRRLLSGDLDNIVLTAMRKEPERRYASVEALSDDIRRHLEGLPVRARRPTLLYRTMKFFERQRAAVIAACVVFALTLGALFWSRQYWRPDTPPRIKPLTTFPGDENQPAFSPDGRRLAFVWNGPGAGNPNIYAMGLAEGGLTRITNDAAQDTGPVWSPDGAFIAFLRSSSKEAAIYRAPFSGGVQVKTVDLFPARLDAVGIEGSGRPFDWSPDGRQIAVGDRTSAEAPFSVFLVTVNSGAKRRLTIPPGRTIGDRNPVFSPDGGTVCFLRAPSSGVTDLYTVPTVGGAARRITFDNRDIVGHTWTRDGSAVVFASNRSGSYQLWRVPVAGGTPERVAGIGQGVSDPSFSTDGRRLAYSQFFIDTNIWQLNLADPRAPAKLLIVSTQYDSSAQFSPDGKRIVFRSTRSGNNEIWVSDSEGMRAVKLTDFGGPLTGTPRWSPDGRWIVFDSRPDGQADIFIVSAEGGAPRRLTRDGAEDVVPSWSRDGKWIYFASNRSGTWQVWKQPVADGEAEQVTATGGFAAFESPDGKYVYYAKGRTAPGLWRKPLANPGQEEPVLSSLKEGFWGYWAIANKGIYYADEVSPNRFAILYYDLAAHRSRQIAPIEKRPMIGDSAFAVSPDEHYILYTQVDQSGSDILLADYSRSGT